VPTFRFFFLRGRAGVLRFFLKGSIISFLIVFIFIIDMDKLTQEEISEFREIFNLVDKDGGGSITKVELAELMDTLGIDASPEEIDAMISEIDQGMR
jgi:hypothetical protein